MNGHGGARRGAGRKPGSANVKTREIVDTAVVRGVKLPLEYMLAVIGDETAPQARRDAMAVAAASYCHPKLASVTTTVGLSGRVGGGGGGGNVDIVTIYAVPRGARFGSDGTITIEGEATELKPVAPFEGTPPLALTDQSEMSAPLAEPLPVVELETDNVTRLDSFVRRRSDDDDPAGAAGC